MSDSKDAGKHSLKFLSKELVMNYSDWKTVPVIHINAYSYTEICENTTEGTKSLFRHQTKWILKLSRERQIKIALQNHVGPPYRIW